MEELMHAYSLGANFLVLRGRGAGGFIESDCLPVLEDFIPEARSFLEKQRNTSVNNPRKCFLIAGGGLATGESVARCLHLGADGVCLGTKFAATEESDLSTQEKKNIVASTEGHHFIHYNPDGTKVFSGAGAYGIYRIKSAKEVVEELVLGAISASTSRHW
eukprot:CAMPEP_0182417708 /NCGR_PEP_ID=MMETSP1167-20130531/2141_1 /TAXON_ID=2988 /ORGANISM="Mallomonas Sp, Strain CCMP3275" /LENGTH=160 /DNA_ID=CAMNT_0024591431 /DNA_START=619 /DNA_END=1098 /DNA_ORIENTATION=-